MIKEIKNTVPWTYAINDLNGEQIIGTIYEKELQKTNQEEFGQKNNKINVSSLVKKKTDYNTRISET